MVAILRWTLAALALAGIVLVYRRWLHANQTTVALSLLLLILVVAAQWGLRYAVVLSLAATACYNFFFLPPIGEFTIADPQNWLALFAFLATAIIASRLSQTARDEAREARQRQRELEVLLSLSRELLQTESVATLLSTVPSAVASVTGARYGLLYLLEGGRLFQAGPDVTSDVELPHLHQLATALTEVHCETEEIQMPLRTGVRPRGLLLLRGTSLTSRTAEGIGGLVALCIDRAQALESVARGEAAKESERLRALMIDSVTHELRTPLTSIRGAATSLLTTDVADANVQRELLSIIDEETDRLNRLVSEAVEVAQLDAQQVQMRFEPVAVDAVVSNALQTCSTQMDGHKVEQHIPGDLRLRADPAYVEKILCNLLENAAKYSAPGTPIVITAEQRGEAVALSIADRGIGIEADEQALIFERFYRARGGNSVGGTGMGLAISRAIAQAHGGEISLRTQPGQGSVFTVTLPAMAK